MLKSTPVSLAYNNESGEFILYNRKLLKSENNTKRDILKKTHALKEGMD